MSVDQRWWIGGRAHGLHGSWVLQLGWSWGLLEADEFGVPFKIMGRDKIKQEHHSWPSEVQIKQINAPCFLRFLHQDWIEFCKSANPWKIYWRYCVHQCSRICFCDFAKTEGIIVLFSVLACCVLPFVEKDFHARRRAAAAEAANRSGQLVQMAWKCQFGRQ